MITSDRNKFVGGHTTKTLKDKLKDEADTRSDTCGSVSLLIHKILEERYPSSKKVTEAA